MEWNQRALAKVALFGVISIAILSGCSDPADPEAPENPGITATGGIQEDISEPIVSDPGQVIPKLDCERYLETLKRDGEPIDAGSVPSDFKAVSAIWCRPTTVDEEGRATKPGTRAGAIFTMDDVDPLFTEVFGRAPDFFQWKSDMPADED